MGRVCERAHPVFYLYSVIFDANHARRDVGIDIRCMIVENTYFLRWRIDDCALPHFNLSLVPRRALLLAPKEAKGA